VNAVRPSKLLCEIPAVLGSEVTSLMFQLIAGFRKISEPPHAGLLQFTYEFNSALLSRKDGLIGSIHQSAPTP
jgi:hypothetical protein